MTVATERLRNHVASYKSLSRHRQNCLDVCDEVETLRKQVDASGGLDCPSCENVGFTVVQINDDDFEQEQCEFCYTVPDSIFNRVQHALTTKCESVTTDSE